MTEDQFNAIMGTLKSLETLIKSRSSSASSAKVEPLEDHHLDKPWADKKIDKDQPRWDGPSFVGLSYAVAPPEYLKHRAQYYLWKAEKGKAETISPQATPRKFGKNGKPYWESDMFEAKLLLAWAARNASERVAGDGIPF